MSRPEKVHEGTFYHRALRTHGHERVIRGLTVCGVRCVEVALIVEGDCRGSTQITCDAAPVVAAAIECVRTSRAYDVGLGRFADGQYDVEVRAGRHPSGRAVYFKKPRTTLSLCEPGEIDALENALAWLTGQ